jgi:hypothetical protein
MKILNLAKKIPLTIHRGQSGQALVIVLVLLMIGSLTLSPVLSLVNNSLKDGRIYDKKVDESYAAKSGIEDATWQIKNDKLGTLFHTPDYNPYDYNTVWQYSLDENVNGLLTDVTIQNIWLPKDLDIPTATEARGIIALNKLVVTGETIQTGITLPDSTKISKYQAKITYFPGESENLTVASFGIWLPRGFEYFSDMTHKSSLETNPIPGHPVTVAVSRWAGNEAVIWTYSTFPDFTELPVQGTLPMTADITFYIKSSDQTQPDAKPFAVPWIKTGNGAGYGIPYSWDADISVYKVVSEVGGTTIESYFAKSALRQLQEAISGDYYATGNSALSDTNGDRVRETWHDPSTSTVGASNIPSDAEVAYAFLYWSGWKNENSMTTVLNDSCSTLPGNWVWNSSTSTWSVNGGGSAYFTANYGGSHTVRDLALSSPRDLSPFSMGGEVTISWDQWTTAAPEQSEIRLPFSDDTNTGGFTASPLWSKVDETIPNDSDYITGVTNGGGRATFGFSPFTVPAGVTVTSLKIYYRNQRASSGSAKAGASLKVGNTYYDNLDMVNASNGWQTSVYTATTNPKTGLSWTVADICGTGPNPLQMFGVSSNDFNPDVRFSMVYAEVNYAFTISASDGLDYYLSKNGTNWYGPVQAFRGNIGSSPVDFSATIPSVYLTSNFKIKFTLVGFTGSGLYANIDNITIKGQSADTSVVFKINDGTGLKQVYFDSNGLPQQGNHELEASRSQILRNYFGSDPHGYSYSSYRDVTDLVRTYSKAPVPPDTNWTGYGTYSVGGIYASTARDGQSPDEWAYANWSLIIIYTSPATQGHQLFLFDKMIYSNQDTFSGVNVDFDGDGEPGGSISGFIVPSPVEGEINAAKITTYIGDGDVWYDGDYIAMNGTKLWDGTSTTSNSRNSPNNVFNSTSMGLGSYDGIDIDTLGYDPPNGQYITWDSGILEPGDTSAQIDMVTHTDVWNVIYIILSFRSKTSIGGILSYRFVSQTLLLPY